MNGLRFSRAIKRFYIESEMNQNIFSNFNICIFDFTSLICKLKKNHFFLFIESIYNYL